MHLQLLTYGNFKLYKEKEISGISNQWSFYVFFFSKFGSHMIVVIGATIHVATMDGSPGHFQMTS